MKKRFKKIYIEITNRCNLNCSFCENTNRKKQDISVDNFEIIINKIKIYTDYVYLHVKGEPLLHKELDKIIEICNKNNIKVNITTNGTLISENIDILKNIRQLNVSLHSENNKLNYFDEVIDGCKILSNSVYISYRLWILNNYQLDKKGMEIVEILKEKYNLSIETVDKIINNRSTKIFNNTYVDKNNLFVWPNESDQKSELGYCYGLNTHIAILVDGTVIPCCIDGEGVVNLGNIFIEDLDDILNKEKTKNIIENFKNRRAVESLCKSCTFKNKF